jgi:hypothetical protein
MSGSQDRLEQDGGGNSTQTLKAVLGCGVGVACAAAIRFWPEGKAPIQILLYTFFVFGPLAFGLWSSRHRPKFWIGALLLFAAHAVALFFIRSTFPFRSVLAIIPLALVECCALYLIMLKLVGDAGNRNDLSEMDSRIDEHLHK